MRRTFWTGSVESQKKGRYLGLWVMRSFKYDVLGKNLQYFQSNGGHAETGRKVKQIGPATRGAV